MTGSEVLEVAARLGIAALGGLAVGTERESSTRARGRPPRFAGVRTVLLLRPRARPGLRRVAGAGLVALALASLATLLGLRWG